MEQEKNESLFELQVDYDSGNYFKEATKWSTFVAIIYFIGIGFIVLFLAIAGAAIFSSDLMQTETDSPFAAPQMDTSALRIALMFVIIVFVTYSGVMLYRFSSLCRQGIDRQDQLVFNSGLKALRNFFIAAGIMAMVGIVSDLIDLATLL